MKKSLTIICFGILAVGPFQAKSYSIYDIAPGGITPAPISARTTIVLPSVPAQTTLEVPSLDGALALWEAPSLPDELQPCVLCGYAVSTTPRTDDIPAFWNTGRTLIAYMLENDGKYAGTVTISTGKVSKYGTVSIKATFKKAQGATVVVKAKSSVNADGSIDADWPNVKRLGDASLIITADGAVFGVASNMKVASEYAYSDGFVHGVHVFSVDVGDFKLPEGYALIEETIPTEATIVTSDVKAWNTGKAPNIKYKKFKKGDYTWYELQGLNNEEKTNYSHLKLKFNKKNGKFTGTFRVFATNADTVKEGKPPKLVPYVFKVNGAIVGTEATCVATCKKLNAIWPVTIE